MTKLIDLGHHFPEFDLKATLIDRCQNIELEGHWSIIFIYPKDNTSGCTKETQEFNEIHSKLSSSNVSLYGLSKDSIESHEKFSKKLSLTFPLISDPELVLLKKLGCWVEKSMYGKKYMGVERTTFLVSKDCKIAHIWRKVKVKNHVKDVLNKIEEVYLN